jgi:ATP-dependent DNA helicase RecG
VDALDDKEYTGGLVELLQDGIGFIMRNSKKAWKKLPDRRVELPEYPERAVTEGLVNALIHRSYTELGSEVHIDMFDDRLEIYSPGGMVDGTILDNKDVTPVPSKRRNPVLADIFNRLNYMERRGSGFKKIMDDAQDGTQGEIAKKTNTSLRTIKRHTVAISKIAYVGSGDKGHWEVTDNE